MGLDQTIYRTTKKRLYAVQDYESKVELLHEWFDKFLAESADTLPKDENGFYYEDKFTKEQAELFKNLRVKLSDKAKELGISVTKENTIFLDSSRYGLGEDDTFVSIANFSNEWLLHKFIVENFWSKDKRDNLIEIPLSKEALEKLIEAGFAPETFRYCLSVLDDNHVIYYWPWY